MKTPRFTDAYKYPHGYRKAAETDITLTFKRARQKQAENAQEVAVKVSKLERRK